MPHALLPLPDGIELEADAAAHARFLEDDRRAELEDLTELEIFWRLSPFDFTWTRT